MTSSNCERQLTSNFFLDPNASNLIIKYEVKLFTSGEDGSKTLVNSKTAQKKIKLKQFSVHSDVSKIAKQIVNSAKKYVVPSDLGEIESLLRKLKERLRQNQITEENTSQIVEEVRVNRVSISETKDITLKTKITVPSANNLGQQNVERKRKEKNISQRNDQNMSNFDENAFREQIRREELAKIQREQLESDKVREKEILKKSEEEEAERLQEIEDFKKRLEEKRRIQEEKQKEKDEKVRKSDEEKKKRKRKKQLKKLQREIEKNMPNEESHMEDLNLYIDMLYDEDVITRIRGTYFIKRLVQEPRNLQEFMEQRTLLNSLFRILKEDWERNAELTTNILEILFCFSTYSDLHSVLLENKIGDTCMKVITLEIRRYGVFLQDNSDMSETRLWKFLYRQEKLLYVAFYLLLNLAEDVKIELKMVKRHIVKLLSTTLNRKNENRVFLDELFILVLSFLKRLSIHKENKENFLESEVIEKMERIFDTENDDLLLISLRFLFNCSFDPDFVNIMVKKNYLQMFMAHIHTKFVNEVIWKIFYNVSVIENFTSNLVETKGLCQNLVNCIIEVPSRLLPVAPVSLGINLALDKEGATLLTEGESLKLLMKRVIRTQDQLLMKFVRALAVHMSGTFESQRIIPDLVNTIIRSTAHDFLVEALGAFANLQLPNYKYSDLLKNYPFVDSLKRLIVPGFAEDDLVLEAVIAFGIVASDEDSGILLANRTLLNLLVTVLGEKKDDEEICLQIVFTLYKFVLHAEIREILRGLPQFVQHLLSLTQDENTEIQNYANQALEEIMNDNEDIKIARFEAYNKDFLTCILDDHDDLSEDDDDNDLRLDDEDDAFGMYGGTKLNNPHPHSTRAMRIANNHTVLDADEGDWPLMRMYSNDISDDTEEDST